MANEETNLEKFAAMLKAAIEWLRDLDIRVDGTRFTKYLKQLDEIIAIPDLEARPGDPRFERVLEAFDSGGELLVIQRDLSQYDSLEFRRRLSEFVKGPYFQREESLGSSSNQARDLGFELVFAAQLANAQFTPILPSDCDLRTEYPGIRFECKRVQSEKKVENAIREARRQLSAGDQKNEDVHVIALSLGKLMHGGSKYLHGGDHREVQREIDEMLVQFVQRHRHTWQKDEFEHVSGIWLHYSGTAVFTRLRAFVRATYNRVIVRPHRDFYEHEVAIRILAEQLEKTLGYEPLA